MKIAVGISLFTAAIGSWNTNTSHPSAPVTSLRQWNSCADKWKYVTPSDNFDGIVIYHANADFLCGLASTASVTLVRTAADDTIRVLELCNIDKKFVAGQKVTVKPEKDDGFRIDVVPDDPKACKLKITCFGVISARPK